MRWWLRLVITLVLAPALWWLTVAYLATQQGGAAWSDLFAQIIPVLESVYLVFTLPALVVCGVLALSDLVLHRLGLDLLTVLISPLLAGGIAALVLHFVHDPHVQSATGAVPLGIIYGLIWGLTIREPRNRRPARRQSAAADMPNVAAGNV